jgi:hypothetical protein
VARTSGTGVEVEGGPELQRAFHKLGARTEKLADMYGDMLEGVADAARVRAPRRSGDLRDSVQVDVTATGGTVTFGAGLEYGGPIHFGWRERNIEPQPFLYDALDAERENIDRRANAEADELVRRFDREAP